MSQKIRDEMLPRLRQRYANRGMEGRSGMITELCEQFGYSRKPATKLLGAKAGRGGDALVRKGRPALYGPQVVEVLLRIWKAAEQPCGQRLVAMLAQWLPYEGKEHGRLSPQVRRKVLDISPAQADRLLMASPDVSEATRKKLHHRPRRPQPLRPAKTTRRRPASGPATGAAFQSPYGLLALRARRSY